MSKITKPADPPSSAGWGARPAMAPSPPPAPPTPPRRPRGRIAMKPGERLRPVSIALNEAHRDKLYVLGGPAWIRAQIENAPLPEDEPE